MKRFATFLLALIMIMSLATTAFAEGENNTITINNTKNGETYALYKMFDLVDIDDSTDPATYTYKVNAAWEDFFAEDGAGAQYITKNPYNDAVTIVGEDKAAQEANAAALAKAAGEWAGKPSTNLFKPSGTSGQVVFSNLENGYWLITSTLGTVAMAKTTPDANNVTINEKNPENTITKKVKEGNDWVDANDAQIGDKVEFQSVVTLYPGTRNVVIEDTMAQKTYNITPALKYNDDLVVKNGEVELEVNKDYSFITVADQNVTFAIKFSDEYIDGLEAKTELTLTYSATLSSSVLIPEGGNMPSGTVEYDLEINPQLNTIVVKYGNTQSVKAETETTTHKFSVFKHAANSTENLAGAVFSLKDKDGNVVKLHKHDDTNYTVASSNATNTVDTFVTVAEGDIVIWGVDSDEYTLVEVTAPEGYNLLKEPVTVTVNADNGTRVDVENQSGTELPSTGGVGTTMFYIFGGILVLAAVVLLVTKKRMAVAE